MKNALVCLAFVALFSVAAAKSDFFPDVSEDEYTKLQEIARYLQQRVEEAEAEEEGQEIDPESDAQSLSSKYELNPPFEYTIPEVNTRKDEAEPFAVGPSDPRFYQEFANSVETVSDVLPEKKEKRPRVKVLEGVSGLAREVSTVNVRSPETVRQVPVPGIHEKDGKADIYFTGKNAYASPPGIGDSNHLQDKAIVAGCSAAAVVAAIGIGIGCYRLQKNAKAAADVDYPAYGVTGPNKDISPTSGDRRLAQSAQMYHYQHQKQQIIAMESVGNKDRRNSISDAESEEENEEGDYTVYECPGLASTGEMEVKNPLFQDDQTPVTKPANDSTEESRELPK